MTRTVLFGPFIGEFGWELLFWQGWVRKVCRDQYSGWRKIACSFPGRRPFYPDVDEFWALPPEYLQLKASANAYFADGWREGFPGTATLKWSPRQVAYQLLGGKRPHMVKLEEPIDEPEVEPRALKMLADLRAKLPPDAVIHAPWQWNVGPDGVEFGVKELGGRLPRRELKPVHRIPFEHQLLERLEPTAEGRAYFAKLGETRPLIAVFPRNRPMRRVDKNWAKEKYEALVEGLARLPPDARVAIFGEPGGAYFADGVPAGCLDLINVDPGLRMDIQIAALQNARLAVGCMSGAMLVAAAAGTPTVIWGIPEQRERYHKENYMGTPMVYHPDVDAPVDAILAHAARSLARLGGPT